MTIEQLIKLLLGILVFAAVVTGIYFFFKDSVIDFFKNLGGNETGKTVLFLIK